MWDVDVAFYLYTSVTLSIKYKYKYKYKLQVRSLRRPSISLPLTPNLTHGTIVGLTVMCRSYGTGDRDRSEIGLLNPLQAYLLDTVLVPVHIMIL